MNIIQRIIYAIVGKSHIDRLKGKLEALVADAEATAEAHLKDAAQAAEHIKIIEAVRDSLARDASKAQAIATAARQVVDQVI